MIRRRTRSLRQLIIFFVGLGLVGLPAAAAGSPGGAPGTARATNAATTAKPPVKKKRTTSAATRRARLARARAAARAREAGPHFKTNAQGELEPDVRAAAAIIYNPETNEVIWEENSQNQRSIASITKVMTAAVVLEDSPDLTREVAITRKDVYRASHTYLRSGERLTLDDLLHLTLVASDNAAARALARTSPLGPAAFVERMNEKARELGLEHTAYADPSGLDADNVSSAFDMARLIAFASSDERIARIMRKPYYTVLTNRRVINIHSTNKLVVKGDVDVRGGKTGFIRKAGYCLATLLRLPHTGQQYAVVVLGAKSSAGRFSETRHLLKWLSDKMDSLDLPVVTASAEPEE